MMCIYQYPVTPSPASDSTTVIQRKGTIQPIRMEKEPYEAVVSAEGSRFHLLFGSQYSGNFLCIPDWCNRRTPPDGFAEQNGRDAERAD